MERENYVRVSTVLSYFQDLSNIPPDILEKKAAIGTDVHSALCARNNGVFYVVSDKCKGYVESALRWIEDRKADTLWTERQLYNDEWQMKGTPDAMVKIFDESHLIDYKTSHAANLEIWGLQGGFYHYMYKQSFGNEFLKLSKDFIFVQLDKNGGKAKEHVFEIGRDTYDLCNKVLDTYRYFNKKTPKDNFEV